MKNNMHPKTLLTATVVGKRSRDRKFLKVRYAMIYNVNLTVPNAGKDGRIDG